MPKNLSIEETIARGRRMREIAQDPVMADAFADAEASCVDRWKIAKSPEAREQEWATIRALAALLEQFQAVINAGDMAEHAKKLEENRRPPKKV